MSFFTVLYHDPIHRVPRLDFLTAADRQGAISAARRHFDEAPDCTRAELFEEDEQIATLSHDQGAPDVLS